MFQPPNGISISNLSGERVQNSLCTESTIEMKSEPTVNNEKEIRVYKRRFWMLLLYYLLAMLNGMLFPQYVSTANVTGCYYGVSQTAVNWTLQIFLFVYLLFIVPATMLMNYMDLRNTFICGSVSNTMACLLQFLTLKSDGFVFVMISNFFASITNMFTLGLGLSLAARWFPSHELSRACAFGTSGNAIGVSIGLIFSPLLVATDCDLKDEIEEGKRNVAFILTALNVAELILIIFTFQNKPDLPPNVAQFEKDTDKSGRHTVKVILMIMRNPNYILVFALTGLMTGTFYAFTTTANNLMIRFFPGQEVEIAGMTTLFTVMGIAGFIICGCVLDYTHRFKETYVSSCAINLLLYILFSGLLHIRVLWAQFIAIGLYGFVQAGFLPVALEYGAEVCYPAPELISANLLFWSMQMCGLILTQIVSYLLENYGAVVSNIAVAINLLICFILATFLTRNYKRMRTENEVSSL